MAFRKMCARIVLLGPAIVSWCGAQAHADLIENVATYSGSGTDTLTGGDAQTGSSTVSATVDFLYDATTSQLLIDLSNTTAQNQLIGNDDTVTQLAFNLASLSLSSGHASGETATYHSLAFTPSGSVTSLDTEWGGGPLVAVPSESAFQVLNNDNYAVTSFTDSLLTTGHQAFTSFSGAGIGSGSNYGVIPTVSGPADADNFIGNNPYTFGTVYIAFNVSGPVTASDLSGINFIFGTADPPNAIIPGTFVIPSPEPSTFVLVGLGLACLAACRAWRGKSRARPAL